MRKFSGAVITLIVAVVFALASCGDDDPTRVGRPPVIQGFTPVEQFLDVFVGDSLRFSIRAMDPDNDDLHETYLLGDSVVWNGPTWDYVVEDTGLVMVECEVFDDDYTARIRWEMHSEIPINYPPQIIAATPAERSPRLIVGTSLEFGVDAIDPDGDSLSFSFELDGRLVASTDEYTYLADTPGERTLEAIVSDGEHTVGRDWLIRVTGEPDTIPPADVAVTLIETGVEPGELKLEWTAVGEDGMQGMASEYHVRTSPALIITESDWQRASERPRPPAPLAPGQTMSMTLADLTPGRFTYVAVRAEDDFGNLSANWVSPGAFTRGMRVTGRVLDAVTALPLENVLVRMAYATQMTAADGTFEFLEMQPVDDEFSLTDDDIPGSLGQYYDFKMPYAIQHNDYIDIPLVPDTPLDAQEYETFYAFFRSMTDVAGIPYESDQRRWDLPINLYVPAYVNNGLDYKATIESAAAEIDAIFGTQAFNFVSSPPAEGVVVVYRSDITNDNFGVTSWSNDYFPVTGKIEFRTLYSSTTGPVLRIVALHELGHALGLNHSQSRGHMMIGGQTPGVSFFSSDEQKVLRAYYQIPRGVDVTGYRAE